jgi:hypothetical protein
MDKKILMKSILSASILGIVFHLLIPLGLLFLINSLRGAALVVDPLQANEPGKYLWKGFFLIIILQIIYAVLVSLSVGALSAWLVKKIKSGRVFLAAAVLSFIVHLLFLAVFALGLYFVSSEEKTAAFLRFSMVFALLVSAFIGLICAGVARPKPSQAEFAK